MRRADTLTLSFAVTAVVLWLSAAGAEHREVAVGGFLVESDVVVSGTPEVVFDLFTGDILPWWDHHLSEEPVALRIDPFPGGHFMELFDHNGNGAVHATVIVADRGKLLRMDGPLGFTGHAVHMVHTLTFAPEGEDATCISLLSVRAAGELEDGWAAAVDGVWNHFLVEAFKPYADRQPKKEHSRRN